MIDRVSEFSLVLRGQDAIRRTFRHLGGGAGVFGDERVAAQMSQRQINHLSRVLRECVDELGGELSARQRAAQLGELYLSLGDDGKLDFLHLLLSDFDPSPAAIHAAIDRYRDAGDDRERRSAEAALRRALTAPRRRVFTHFSSLPDGVKFLVGMRADILRLISQDPALEALDEELGAMLSAWFDVGFLTLRRISWDSPASLLEKLVSYEAVHEIRSWKDLRNRLDSDRRCYAFFHPRMPEEPLIFVEIALVREMAGNIRELLNEKSPTLAPEKADTAIFYSISNTQAGLRGVSFGNFLIKRVVEALRADFPWLKTFATLSPVPVFGKWLRAELARQGDRLLGAQERQALAAFAGETPVAEWLQSTLEGGEWRREEALAKALQRPLMRLCAGYLSEERSGAEAYDPVARFHLGNGARIERLNWLGDVSSKGMRQSAGMMVNYLYALDDIESNHEAYARDGRIVTSSGVRRHLRKR